MKPHIPAFCAAFVLFAAQAAAETVKENGFSAAFPCASQQQQQAVAAGKLKIPVATRLCEGKDAVYYVVVSDFPKGFIARKSANAALADAVGGAAANVKGAIRTNQPFLLGGVLGRDTLIDVPGQNATVHLRVFFAGDRQFQAMVVAPKGRENGKAALAFLNSFKLGK
jgi:hypothetical protein